MTAAVEVYGAGLEDGATPLVVRYEDGSARSLPVGVWTADDVLGDSSLLDRCSGATLDVGCGPGRLTVALAFRGLPALGVDIAPAAVQVARVRGALVLTRSVFEALPGTGRWRHALLADGNLGIGGDPAGLLRRLSELLCPGGDVLAELDAPGTCTRAVRVRVEHGDRHSAWFPWAHVGVDDVAALADASGLHLNETWTVGGRWFAALRREHVRP